MLDSFHIPLALIIATATVWLLLWKHDLGPRVRAQPIMLGFAFLIALFFGLLFMPG